MDSMTQTPAFDGKPAKLVELTNQSGMRLVVMDIGATWLSCVLPLASGEKREVLLGNVTMADFKRQHNYMGATVGRYANRIAQGRFDLHDVTYQVSTNQSGNCLHGGEEGFDKRRWTIEAQSQSRVTFGLLSSDGDQGFPGNLSVSVSYELTSCNQVKISYFAKSDKATPVNLTNHAYFNLAGAESGEDCLSHYLAINAEQFVPTNGVGIPIGVIESVAGTGFDFRVGKTISTHFMQDNQQISAKGYDHSYLFTALRDVCEPIAMVMSPDEQVRLYVKTDKPAMQLYTGNWLAGAPNRSGGVYGDYAGLALETQFLPDSPNNLEWLQLNGQSNCILEPDQEYQYQTTYQFEC
ncbi:galactose-1-epimerase [Vibrio sinensis]|uniref:Aldose 1-epimerase n=1 Tax=Vibrio sinensis TaxID=2302434 RepID=A0A3A6QB09_9VIBR|nr:galactose-1-epimerase [Vibrio sinensis]RJX69431.1 galactose-1-epimerase [Vibrio sinensis]